MAANCMVSPMRTELPEGATFTPFEVDSDAPTFMPPPQPDHRESANNKMTMLLNFTREDFLDPTISESPFLKIRARAKNLVCASNFRTLQAFQEAGAE
jgi:hypothetical protein